MNPTPKTLATMMDTRNRHCSAEPGHLVNGFVYDLIASTLTLPCRKAHVP